MKAILFYDWNISDTGRLSVMNHKNLGNRRALKVFQIKKKDIFKTISRLIGKSGCYAFSINEHSINFLSR